MLRHREQPLRGLHWHCRLNGRKLGYEQASKVEHQPVACCAAMLKVQ
jgi:hypothetical protein